MTHLGIDPGTVNIGIAITDDSGGLVYSRVIGIGELGGIDKVINFITGLCEKHGVVNAGIERFVSYRGILSSSAEEIIMLIGACWYALTIRGIKIKLVRAIEWKSALCKYLVKNHGFDNPSSSFDKKYSRAAAEAITKIKLRSDHEADAACLSFIWKI